MSLEKKKAFIINFIFAIIIIGLVYFFLKRVISIFFPFVFGLVVAVILMPFIRKTSKAAKINQKICAVVFLLVFYALLVAAIMTFGDRLFNLMENLAKILPGYYQKTIEPQMTLLFSKIVDSFPEYKDVVMKIGDNLDTTVQDIISRASSGLIGVGANFVVAFPTMLLQLVFMVISSFFFTMDYETIKFFVLRQFPEKKSRFILEIWETIRIMVWKILKCYIFLMVVTFLELYIGFSILRISMPMLLAFLVAIVDILPVLGTGTVLIPWGIISCIIGNTRLGVGILLLYLIITVVRQVLEPKVIGKQVGLHPIITLICIFAGAKFLGVLGIFLFPVVATVIKKMNDDGTIHLYK